MVEQYMPFNNHNKNLIQSIKAGDVWLNKVKYEGTKRIRGNVCLEVYLPSRGTCLCWSTLTLEPVASNRSLLLSLKGCKSFVELHSKTNVWERLENTYLLPQIDRLDLESWVLQTSCGGTVSHTNSSDEPLTNTQHGEVKATAAYSH